MSPGHITALHEIHGVLPCKYSAWAKVAMSTSTVASVQAKPPIKDCNARVRSLLFKSTIGRRRAQLCMSAFEHSLGVPWSAWHSSNTFSHNICSRPRAKPNLRPFVAAASSAAASTIAREPYGTTSACWTEQRWQRVTSLETTVWQLGHSQCLARIAADVRQLVAVSANGLTTASNVSGDGIDVMRAWTA